MLILGTEISKANFSPPNQLGHYSYFRICRNSHVFFNSDSLKYYQATQSWVSAVSTRHCWWWLLYSLRKSFFRSIFQHVIEWQFFSYWKKFKAVIMARYFGKRVTLLTWYQCCWCVFYKISNGGFQMTFFLFFYVIELCYDWYW